MCHKYMSVKELYVSHLLSMDTVSKIGATCALIIPIIVRFALLLH